MREGKGKHGNQAYDDGKGPSNDFGVDTEDLSIRYVHDVQFLLLFMSIIV